MNYNLPNTNIFWHYARYRVRKKMFDFITSRQSIIQKPKDFVADHQRYIRCYTDFFNEVGSLLCHVFMISKVIMLHL